MRHRPLLSANSTRFGIRFGTAVCALLAAAALAAAAGGPVGQGGQMPWRQAGLTERQAAAHLLDRFAYGPRPGEVDAVVAMGLDAWLDHQLAADLPEPDLGARLRGLDALSMPARQLAETFPNPGRVVLEARQAGVLPQDVDPQSLADASRRDLRAQVLRFARERGYRPQRELLTQLTAAKLLRAVYAENQLREVLTDFWFNHFNVSLTDNQARGYLLSYERDAVRPHVLGRFRDLLEATARHPAMLLYLDNAQSTAAPEAETTLDEELGGRGLGARRGGRPGMRRPGGRPGAGTADAQGLAAGRMPSRGINENYARELLELHTLGVDGGYDQHDVVEVARAFTGWTVLPPWRREEVERRLERARRFGGLGFVVEGEFLFRADAHDAGAKRVIGVALPAGRGIEDGEQVLDLLARSPATAHHLAEKLAVRFVADDPPPALVDRLAGVYLATGGDLSQVVRAIAAAPEFWSSAVRRQKIKAPFELVASAIRALGAEVSEPRSAVEWIGRIGEPLYAYQAPTGYPDRAGEWVSTGALLNRMSFGLELAAGRVWGVRVDLAALTGGREPESAQAALLADLERLLPERPAEETVRLLTPMLRDPRLPERVAGKAPADAAPAPPAGDGMMGDPLGLEAPAERGMPVASLTPSPSPASSPSLSQVAGLILGSPEFQRR